MIFWLMATEKLNLFKHWMLSSPSQNVSKLCPSLPNEDFNYVIVLFILLYHNKGTQYSLKLQISTVVAPHVSSFPSEAVHCLNLIFNFPTSSK